MIGVIARYSHFAVTIAVHPIDGGVGHAPASSRSVRTKQIPVGCVGGPPAVGHPVEPGGKIPRSVGEIPRTVACSAARCRTSSGVWFTMAVRPPSRAAFDTAL